MQRFSGPGDILALLRREGPLTRGELQEITGLSRMTVTQRVTALQERSLIAEADGLEPTGGRRAGRLSFDPSRGYFAVEAMETTRARTAITDLDGRVIAARDCEARIADGPAKALAATVASIRTLLAEADLPPDRLRGVGLSLPGPIDPGTGRPSEPPIMPGWDGWPVAEQIAAEFGRPALIENDGNAMALGIYRWEFPTAQSLVLIKCSTGIGSGIVIGGELIGGVDGGAGDIGHIRISSSNRICRCGSLGCLAAEASGWAVAEKLTEAGLAAEAGHDVRAWLDRGEAVAAQLVQEAGRHIGKIGATLVSVLNPQIVVLAGDLASTPLLGGFRETLYAQTLPRATRSLDIVVSNDPDAAIRGIAQALADRIYSPAAVNRMCV